jgi:hypothetical protein
MADNALPNELIDTGNLPTVISAAGLAPTPPSVLRSMLVEIVARTNPGFTDNLPGTLIEDIVSTDTQALVMMDQARVEALNSLTPYGCNEFVLMLLGKVYGVPIGQPANTSVYAVFTGLPGFVIAKGFTVSDGVHQYVVQDGGICGADGVTPPLYCVSAAPGAWPVPAGTVTALITPPPTGFDLSVINVEPGVPASSAETATQYRSRVLRAGLAASQGMPRYLRTLLSNIPGVQDRLIGIQQAAAVDGGDWMIIVGGGDPYVVAYTIYQALFDITELIGSTTHVLGITNANPAVATTDLDHGLRAGDFFTYTSVNPTAYNGTYRVFSVPTLKTLTMGAAYPASALSAATWAGNVITFTTATAHLMASGGTPAISGCLPDGYNSIFPTCTVTGANTFTVSRIGNPGTITLLGQLNAGIAPFNGTGLPPYVSGGTITPNNRNLTVTITDYPDSYSITYVNPPLQQVTGTVTWNTSSPNYVLPASVAQLAAPALVDYINSINVGAPINVLQMSDAFQNAVISVLPPAFLSRLVFQISINGIGKAPNAGTHVITGDPQSYFYAQPADFNIVQG